MSKEKQAAKKSITEEIERIIEIAKKNNLEEFSLKTERLEISFKSKGCKEIAPQVSQDLSNKKKEDTTPSTHFIVRSPLVGVFYRSPSPGAPPFVEIGEIVEPNQTLCIVEAMKVMNEVSAGKGGRILKIFPENGEMVEFDEPLFELELLKEDED